MVILNPYFLIISGILLIIAGMTILKMRGIDILKFWVRFLTYFLKDSSTIDKYQEDGTKLPLGGWVFLGGWFLLIAGLLRLWGGNI